MIGAATFCSCPPPPPPPPAHRAAQLNTEAAVIEVEAARLLHEADLLSKQANDLKNRRDTLDTLSERASDEARAKRMHARALMAGRSPAFM